VRRGSLYWVNLGTTRPGVLVSNTVQNELLDSVVVVPLSTAPGEIWPLRIEADKVRGSSSCAVLPGIRQVSKTRLMEFIGPASAGFMKRLDEALAFYLND
jgi:mRNA-degrading endonuclease toxin of MazEF toxin-antitoxin module